MVSRGGPCLTVASPTTNETSTPRTPQQNIRTHPNVVLMLRCARHFYVSPTGPARHEHVQHTT